MISGLLGLGIGIFIGYQTLKIRDTLSKIKYTLLDEKEARPTVVSPISTVEPIRPSSAIIEPKTPQQIDFEEQEYLRKLNPGS